MCRWGWAVRCGTPTANGGYGRLFALQTADGFFQLAYSGFGVFQPLDVLFGFWVIPGELPVFPTEIQVEGSAVALQAAVRELFDVDGLVAAVDQLVAGEPGAVELSGLVEAPVLWDAECCVGDSLVDGVRVVLWNVRRPRG